jgi:hypothetical protein
VWHRLGIEQEQIWRGLQRISVVFSIEQTWNPWGCARARACVRASVRLGWIRGSFAG